MERLERSKWSVWLANVARMHIDSMPLMKAWCEVIVALSTDDEDPMIRETSWLLESAEAESVVEKILKQHTKSDTVMETALAALASLGRNCMFVCL